MSLANKTITELRGLAMSLSIADVFQKDRAHLLQEIEAKQKTELSSKPAQEVVQTYVLNSRGKEERCDPDTLEKILEPLKARGLRTRYDEDMWYFSCGKCTDEGTLSMPLMTAVRCAEKVVGNE